MKSLLREHYKKVIYVVIILLVMGSAGFLAINHYVEQRGAQYIYSAQEVPGADAILILGAYVLPDGTLSLMLRDVLNWLFSGLIIGSSKMLIPADLDNPLIFIAIAIIGFILVWKWESRNSVVTNESIPDKING